MNIKDAALFFINKAIDAPVDFITHLKLQKLLYYSQAYYLSKYDESLFNTKFQAWAHGPVSYEIYEMYRVHGYNPIMDTDLFNEDDHPKQEIDHLNYIWDEFGQLSAKELEKMSHEEFPWVSARKETPYGQPSQVNICEIEMKYYYRGLGVVKKHAKEVKPLFTLDELRKVAPTVDRSIRGNDEDYCRVVYGEIEELSLLRERVAGGWRQERGNIQ